VLTAPLGEKGGERIPAGRNGRSNDGTPKKIPGQEGQAGRDSTINCAEGGLQGEGSLTWTYIEATIGKRGSKGGLNILRYSVDPSSAMEGLAKAKAAKEFSRKSFAY